MERKDNRNRIIADCLEEKRRHQSEERNRNIHLGLETKEASP